MSSEEGACEAVNDFGGNVANMQLPKCTKNPNAEREALKSTNVFLCASITQLKTLARAKSVGALHDDHQVIVRLLVDTVFDHDGKYIFSETSKINSQIDHGKYIFSNINSQIYQGF